MLSVLVRRLLERAVRSTATGFSRPGRSRGSCGCSGSPLNVRVEPDAIHVLPRLDGEATLAEAIDRAARESGLDRARIEPAALTTVRRLSERGFLVS